VRRITLWTVTFGLALNGLACILLYRTYSLTDIYSAVLLNFCIRAVSFRHGYNMAAGSRSFTMQMHSLLGDPPTMRTHGDK